MELSNGFCVWLSNLGTELMDHPSPRGRGDRARPETHEADWVGEFSYPGHGQAHETPLVPAHGWCIERLVAWAAPRAEDSGEEPRARSERVEHFIIDLVTEFAGKLPDATSLQRQLSGPRHAIANPDDIRQSIMTIVRRHFSSEQREGSSTPPSSLPFARKDDSTRIEVPLSVAASIVASAFACEEINRGDTWWRRNSYLFGIGHSDSGVLPRVGGCWMPFGIYLYRTRSKATIPQISSMMGNIPRWS